MQKQLTKAEEQIMQVVWKLKKAFLKEIMEELDEPKPHNNTVATILKILVDKGFIKTETFGRMHQYQPAISKEAYSKSTLKTVVNSLFEGDYANAVSFMIKEKKLSLEDLEMLLKMANKK